MSARRIPELVVPGRRLGRHVDHDPRSLNYLVEPTGTAPVSKAWRRYTPILDQGELGSCTGNAATGLLGTAPLYGALSAKRAAGLVLNEAEAVRLYSAATALDSFPGTYPPDDSGSSGLAVAKACQQAGLIGSYQHVTSLAAAHAAILTGPFIVGFNWYTGMDTTDSRGIAHVSGTVRGGHEFEIVSYSATSKCWKAANSWSTAWGWGGYFYLTDADFARLLGEGGDATVFNLKAAA